MPGQDPGRSGVPRIGGRVSATPEVDERMVHQGCESCRGAAITPHNLRHSCASISISAGVNVLALSRMLGHTSAKVTLDTYSDLFDTDLDAVASALDLKCAQSVPKRVPTATLGG